MENLDYIDNYFKGHLNAEESLQFELRIEQDPVFAQDVAFYVSASGILKEQALEDAKERFSELEQMQPVRMKQSPVRKLVYYLAAAAVLIGIVVTLFYLQPVPAYQLADNYISNELNIVSRNNMGPDLQDSLSLAKNFYETKRYDDALNIYNALIPSYPDKDEFTINAGIVSLKANRIENAIEYFENYEKSDRVFDEGKFYHAVALIKRNKSGDQQKAKKMLEEVVKNEDKNHEIASNWLNKMQ